MSNTLLQALSDGSFDFQNKRDSSTDFAKKIVPIRNNIVRIYLEKGTDLNVLVAQVAKREDFNDDQIQRIVEEVNNQVYLIKYTKARDNKEDRDISFPIASVKKVKEISGKSSDTDKSIELKKAFMDHSDSIEKIASETDAYNPAYMFRSGSLSVALSKTEEQFYMEKIASNISGEEQKISNIGKEINSKVEKIAQSFIEYKRLGCDIEKIAGIVFRNGLTKMQTDLIKEATENAIARDKKSNQLPENFSIDFSGVSMEKTAEEKFSLNQYSFLNKDIELPPINTKMGAVKNIQELQKVASEINELCNKLKIKNRNLVKYREKIASYGISEDTFYKVANNIDASIDKINRLSSQGDISQPQPQPQPQPQSQQQPQQQPQPQPQSNNDDSYNKAFNKAIRKRNKGTIVNYSK